MPVFNVKLNMVFDSTINNESGLFPVRTKSICLSIYTVSTP